MKSASSSSVLAGLLSPLLLSLVLSGCATPDGNPKPPPPAEDAACGDGFLDEGEVCDDGNTRDGDGCRSDCLGEERCGDGLLDPDEECDDGNDQDGDDCRQDCTLNTCQNGVIEPGEVCFGAPVELGAPGSALSSAVAVGDLDGDGDRDIVSATQAFEDQIRVFVNTGGGSFSEAEALQPEPFGKVLSLILADVDQDGDQDILAANDLGNLSLLRNLGGGTFAPRVVFPSGGVVSSLAAEDVDQDGDLDLAGALSGNDLVGIFRNNGSGSFGAPLLLPTGRNPRAVAFGRVIGSDSRPDLVVTNATDGTVTVFKGTGNPDSPFLEGLREVAKVGRNPVSVALFDLDLFGGLDIAVVNRQDQTVDIVDNAGGSLALADVDTIALPEVPFILAEVFDSLAASDLNRDGLPDLVVTNIRDIHLLFHDGDVVNDTFTPTLLETGSGAAAVTTADLNGDSVPDIIVARVFGGQVGVFFSEP